MGSLQNEVRQTITRISNKLKEGGHWEKVTLDNIFKDIQGEVHDILQEWDVIEKETLAIH